MDAHLQPASTFIYLANNREKKNPHNWEPINDIVLQSQNSLGNQYEV